MQNEQPEQVSEPGEESAEKSVKEPAEVPEEAPEDVAERPGSTRIDHDHADELVDEWGEESFPGSDPPAHY